MVRFVSLLAQRVRFVSLSAQCVRFGGFARLAARFVFHARRVSACGFTRVSSVVHSGAHRVSFRCAVRSIWMHDAFLFSAQRVRFRVSDGWQRVSFR